MKLIAQGLTALSLLLIPANSDAVMRNYFAFTGFSCQPAGEFGFHDPEHNDFMCPGASLGSVMNGATIDRANIRVTDYSPAAGIRVQFCLFTAPGWGVGGCGPAEVTTEPYVGNFEPFLRKPTGGGSAHVPYIHIERSEASRVWTYAFEDCTAPDLYCP